MIHPNSAPRAPSDDESTTHPPVPAHNAEWLRDDLQREYYAVLDVITDFDQRFMTIKGWSVTLSLAALGFGFQQNHFALFALASVTALGFWFIDVTAKRHQTRYYARMRDIELAAFNLNHVELRALAIDQPWDQPGAEVPLGAVSAPRIDMYWAYPKGKRRDWRTSTPWRRAPNELRKMLRRCYWMPHVLLPHAMAVALGLVLFGAAVLRVGGMPPHP